MGVIETMKDVGVLIQKLDNMELVKRLVELQEQVYAVVTENRDLKEQNRDLREKLNMREQLTFKNNAYFNGDDGPFCSRCFDAEQLLMRLLTTPGYAPHCPKCGIVAVDRDEPPPEPVRRTSRFSRGGY